MNERTFPGWLRGKRIVGDFRAWRFPLWRDALAVLLERPQIRILEVGSLEGCSAVFFLSQIPRSEIVCVDPFYHQGTRHRFTHNVAEFGRRVRLLNLRSAVGLDQLFVEHKCFDLIHIDGAHQRDDVLIDSMMAWRLLNDGGILIWDDYDLVSPKEAIDAFLRLQANQHEELYRGPQLIVRKCGHEPTFALAPVRMQRTIGNLIRLLGPNPPYPRTLGVVADFFRGRLIETTR